MTARKWKVPTVRVSKQKALKRLELERSGEAKCFVCDCEVGLHLIEHQRLGTLVICEVCSEMLGKIRDSHTAKSVEDLRKGILKVHELTLGTKHTTVLSCTLGYINNYTYH